MADSNPRPSFWRSPRQPPSTPYELEPAPLNWQRRMEETSRQPRAPDPWAWTYESNARDELNNEIAENVAREMDEKVAPILAERLRNDLRLEDLPPKYEDSPCSFHNKDPFADPFQDGAQTFTIPSSSKTEEPAIKQEPKDEFFEDDLAPPNRGYMGRSSPFELDSPRDAHIGEMSFMEWYPKGDATITYLDNNGDVETLASISPWMFEERCPLLAQAFEPSRTGPKLFLEALSTTTAKPFLRFLYTGSYAVPGPHGDIYEDVPTSVLLHCQLYQLGDIYDLPDLKQQASVNVTRQCEFGCSSPDKPIDLCAAVKYLYEHLSEHKALIETVICYCVACFLRHRLVEDFEFRTMAYNLRPFHQDLCKESMKREFEDDTAAAIIQMPFEPYVPETYASREDVDCVYRFHGSDDPESPSEKRKRPEIPAPGPGISGISLALRQRRDAEQAIQSEAKESEFEEGHLYIGSKRRLSKAPEIKDEAPVYSSESEYEVIAGPAPVQELSSESESDNETVVVDHPETRDVVLPIRRRSDDSSLPLLERRETGSSDSGSESDWTLL